MKKNASSWQRFNGSKSHNLQNLHENLLVEHGCESKENQRSQLTGYVLNNRASRWKSWDRNKERTQGYITYIEDLPCYGDIKLVPKAWETELLFGFDNPFVGDLE